MFQKKFIFGDTAVYYLETPVEGHENKTVVGLALYPKEEKIDPEKLCLDSLVQAAFTGDESLIDYTSGITMRNRSSTLLRVVGQKADECGVQTHLADGAGNEYLHTLGYSRETGVFTVRTKYENRTGKPRMLEMLSSFSVSGLKAGAREDTEGLTLHRMTSAWSRECRLKSEPFSALGQDSSWARYGVKCERWGQVGSMPNRGYYPFAAIGDEGGTVWGVQIEAPYSWQLELYKEKETCALSGGLADYEFGHWRKRIENGGCFETHNAYIAVRKSGGVNAVCNALVHEADRRLLVPASEDTMPVLFNEYCMSWGNPTSDKIDGILQALKDFPVEYFVVDCGWYKPEDRNWCNAVGDWKENESLFPRGGLKSVAKRINAAGMKAGIWFEYEIAGRDSDVFCAEELFLTRDGSVITCKNRRFFDLRKKKVQNYLDEKVVDFLKENGFGYVKVDYNDAFGIGCDGAESPGEGGRTVAEESLKRFERLQNGLGIVVENCSSGGSRIEPLRMSTVSMCSFSDAHECAEIPLVAANVSRVIPARQSQIWAVFRENEPDSRTVYSLCAAFMGRICLSGDVTNLSEEKKALILNGLNFYSEVKDIVRYGDIREIDCNVAYYRNPVGRQIYRKGYRDRELVILHALDKEDVVEIPLNGFRLDCAFTDLDYKERDGVLEVYTKPFTAGAFLLEKII